VRRFGKLRMEKVERARLSERPVLRHTTLPTAVLPPVSVTYSADVNRNVRSDVLGAFSRIGAGDGGNGM
jgi:hypothetical protein